jgi:predicted dehydrogenase
LKYIADSKFDKNIIWSDKNVNSVIVATPIETHYTIIKEALQNGKHVFSEKPITLFEKQALELKQLAVDSNLKIGVDYTQTFSKSIEEVVNWVDKLDGMNYIEMSTKHLGRFMNFDVYVLLASHHLSVLGMLLDLDILDFKFQDYLYHNGLCTTGSIVFNCGRIDVSTDFPGKEMLINVYCNKGTIKYRPEENSVEVVFYNKKYKALPDELTDTVVDFSFDEKNNLRYAIKYFNDLINSNVVSNLDNAVKITKILESRG